jgi:hypothetical protein
MAPVEDGGGVEFPVGMKVLVVDDDPTCLAVLKRMLLECRYDGEQLCLRLCLSRVLCPCSLSLAVLRLCGRDMIGCVEAVGRISFVVSVSVSCSDLSGVGEESAAPWVDLLFREFWGVFIFFLHISVIGNFCPYCRFSQSGNRLLSLYRLVIVLEI